jgi:hypothetical protein
MLQSDMGEVMGNAKQTHPLYEVTDSNCKSALSHPSCKYIW